MNLTWLDWLVIAIPLAVVLTVALVMRRYLRSVADFLAAGRCVGRYAMCTAAMELGAGVVLMVTTLEVFSQTGFSMGFWQGFIGFAYFFLTLLGFVTFRFRETRVLTFHQFFEVRYSKRLRSFASFLNFFSGLFSFGVAPAVGARFFVYFCGLPEHVSVMGLAAPTFAILMFAFLGVSLFFTLTGGQISVTVTDCLEGIISGIFYIVVAIFIIHAISPAQMEQTLCSGAPGKSYINPFDFSGRPDFGLGYILMGFLMAIYYWRGTAWNQGFAASAKSAHEGQMAGILGVWRGQGAVVMGGLIAIGALTVLHHPAFADKAALVQQKLGAIETDQLRTQMAMPTALGVLLIPGIKGAFCAIGLFGLLAGQGASMHSFGSTFLQDVVLPWRRKPLDPKTHIRWLRWSVFGVGLFSTCFSLVYKPADYLVMVTILISTIYLGGVGAVVLGGLYWKKGTTQGAWVAMFTGAAFSIGAWMTQTFWTSLAPFAARCLGPGFAAEYLTAHADRCPINGQKLAFTSIVLAALGYVIVSLFTCRKNYDMDRLLHRGRYRVEADDAVGAPARKKGFRLGALIGIDEHFTRGDRIMQWVIFCWGISFNAAGAVILIWNLFWRWPDHWWFKWTYFTGVQVAIVVAVITTVWFTVGGIRDLVRLVRDLRAEQPDAADDGTVQAPADR